jgi:Na+/H+ antiporter NhaD/arsenite permease-like protein
MENSASLIIGGRLSYWAIIPFVLMLLSIALLPLFCSRWFERNRNKAMVSAVLGIPTVIYLLVAFGGDGLNLAGKAAEQYVSFVLLLAALYTISGGIHVAGNAVATPRHNLTYLALGSVLANLIGTMGASMVLIRPLLRANSERKYVKHTVIFFIFTVGNIGGLLTPLGDPPLFLGFLNGVPFGWTLRLWPQWLFTLGLVLLVYMALELFYYHRKEPSEALARDRADYAPMRVTGWVNFILLAAVVVTVLFSGKLDDAGRVIHFPFIREVILGALALVSHQLGPKGPRTCNRFSWPPVVEVAVLFAGVFATMIPALALLEAKGASIGLTQPWQYYWLSGGLSPFLDNAPTYLTFTSMAQGVTGAATIGALTTAGAGLLAAISCGSVMMGANSYIGNAPNFAVKSIAEHEGVKMPSFFGYMVYSIAVLVPIFVIETFIFFV